jgi:hypothetical protein
MTFEPPLHRSGERPYRRQRKLFNQSQTIWLVIAENCRVSAQPVYIESAEISPPMVYHCLRCAMLVILQGKCSCVSVRYRRWLSETVHRHKPFTIDLPKPQMMAWRQASSTSRRLCGSNIVAWQFCASIVSRLLVNRQSIRYRSRSVGVYAGWIFKRCHVLSA